MGYLEQKKEELGKRNDSITPPYPAFDAFIRDLIENGVRSRDIAKMIINPRTDKPIEEEIITGWSTGGQVGTNIKPFVTATLGYDFTEYGFGKVANLLGFPSENAPNEIKAIRTNSALKIYLLDVGKKISFELLTVFFGFTHSSIFTNFFDDGKGFSEESLQKILQTIEGLPSQVSGEILSEYTPQKVVSKFLMEYRLASGDSREEMARKIGETVDYLRYMESVHKRTTDGDKRLIPTRDKTRYLKICRFLAKERNRLKLVKFASADESAVLDAGAPLRAENGEVRQSAEETAEYTSPFSHARWRFHETLVDKSRIKLVRLLIMTLIEELGFLASVNNPERRAEIRLILNEPLKIELLAALEAFCQKNPGETLELIESWRRSLKF